MSNNARQNIYGFFQKLSGFRESGLFTDVKILVGERTFSCHRNILAASCLYFEKMLTSEFQESGAEIIELKDIEPDIFEVILIFIYVHRLKVNKFNAYELFKKSNFYTLFELERQVMNYILKYTESVENLLEICEFAYSIENEDFLHNLTRSVANDFEIYSKKENFANISFPVLRSILQWIPCDFESGETTDESSNTKESEKLSVIINWIKKDTEARAGYLPQLLQFVKLPEQYHDILTNTFLEYISDTVVTNCHSLFVFCATTSLNEKSSDAEVISITLKNKTCWVWKKNICLETLTFGAVALNQQIFFMTYEYSKEHDKFINKFFLDDPTEKELLPPPVLASSYLICTVRSSIFLYNDSENFTPLTTAFSVDLKEETLTKDDNILLYNPDLNKWFTIPHIPEKLYNSYMVSCNNLLYMIGGTKEHNVQKSSRRNIMQVYDIRSRNWKKLSCQNIQFSLNGGACVFCEKIYICERISHTKHCPSTQEYANMLYIYNIDDDKWEKQEIEFEVPLPYVFLPFKAQLWLFGYDAGIRGAHYNPKVNSWNAIPDFPPKIITSNGVSRICRVLGAVVNYNDYVY